MKPILALCVLAVAIAVSAVPHETGHPHVHEAGDDHDHHDHSKLHDGKSKVCFKTADKCEQLKSAAKEIIASLKAKKNKILNSSTLPPIGDIEENIPVYIDRLQNLFNISAQTDCHFEVCKCKNSELKCKELLAVLKSPLEKAKMPECLNDSEKAKAILTQFKVAIQAGNREAIVGLLDTLRETIVLSLANGDQEHNDKLVSCLRTTVKEIRTSMKTKLGTLSFQPNCEFCAVEALANKVVKKLDEEVIQVPVPVVPPAIN